MSRTTSILNNWKAILTAFVSVLIVIPSIINAGNDIWISWQGLPIGQIEKINSTMFKKHFKDNPIHTKQILIENSTGTVPITVDVYENGDVLIDYVRYVQWFPIDAKVTSNIGFEFISSAHAWYLKDFSPKGKSVSQAVGSESKKVENRRTSKNEIERVRTLSDGTVEKQIININTGEVKSITRE